MTKSQIELFSEEVSFIYPDPIALKKWIAATINSEDRAYRSINIVFCNDPYLLKLNQEYLSHDYYTDIITFQYEQEPISGDLFISIERVKENAKELDITWEEELHRVIIHGILHLIGYNDKSEDEIKLMRNKEGLYLTLRK